MTTTLFSALHALSFRARLTASRRTPVVLQTEPIESGAIALAIVLRYFGAIHSIQLIRERCGITRSPTTVEWLASAARDFGLETTVEASLPKGDAGPKQPCIVAWNFTHYLVCEGLTGDYAYLNDPASGHRTVTRAEFDRGATGALIYCRPARSFRKTQTPLSSLSQMFSLFPTSPSLAVQIVLLTLLTIVPGLAVPAMYHVFVDDAVVSRQTKGILALVLLFVVAALFKSVSVGCQQFSLLRLELLMAIRSSTKMIWHVFKMPYGVFSTQRAIDCPSRLALTDSIAQLLSNDFSTIIANCVLMVSYGCLMLYYDRTLAIVVIALSFSNVIALRMMSGYQQQLFSALQKEEGKLLATATVGLQAIETLKASVSETSFFSRWAGSQARVVNLSQRSNALLQILAVIPGLLSALSLTAVLAIGGMHVINGSLTIGLLIAFQTLTTSFSEPFSRIVYAGPRLQQVKASVERVQEILAIESVSEPEIAQEQAKTISGSIEFRDVSFGYNRREQPVLKRFSLSIKPGRRVAIVGSSGSGKSTIAKIAIGLLEPWEGEVFVDGTPTTRLSKAAMADTIGSVDQDIFLFHGSVRDNLTLWDSSVDDADVIEASKDAQIHEFVMTLPEGYDFILEEGGWNASGGQRQRFEIARALVNNPRLLILDEATSALDALTEHRVLQSLQRRGCTTLIIAHRLSTIRDCDEIVVLERGAIAECGSHEFLSKREGAYMRLLKEV